MNLELFQKEEHDKDLLLFKEIQNVFFIEHFNEISFAKFADLPPSKAKTNPMSFLMFNLENDR